MRKKTAVAIAAFLLFMGILTVSAWAESIKMRVVAVNPSLKKSQTTNIKSYLPKEVGLDDVIDLGGLEIEYDAEEGLFYVFKDNVVIEPSETKIFEIVMKDVWLVPAEKIEEYRARTDRIMEALKDSPYLEKAKIIADPIYNKLDDITESQVNPNITRQQHMAIHRENLDTLAGIEDDLDKLEKILVAVGGAPNIELIEESDINLKSPSSKTTWILIFVVLIFVAILSSTFYFTWHRQTKITENIFSREKDASFSEFTNPGEEAGAGKEGGPPPKKG